MKKIRGEGMNTTKEERKVLKKAYKKSKES